MVNKPLFRAEQGRGFTLIELMVSLAISMMLMLLAVPFSMAWMDSARQLQARGDLVDAVGRAKGWALRNGGTEPRTWGESVARLRFSAGLLTVENAADDAVIWSAQLPASVSLRLQGTSNAFTCNAYDSRGVAIAEAGCDQAASRLAVTIANREDLNVEIL